MLTNIFSKTLSIVLFSTQLGLAGHAFAQTELRMGVVFPMSGDTATFGQESYEGVQLAVEEINATPGLRIKTFLQDDKSQVADAANAIRTLINLEKVHVVVGTVASSNTNAMGPIAQAAKIPLITPTSTNVNVTRTGDFVSRICFIDDFQGFGMAKFARENLNATKAAIITDSNQDYSRGLAKAFKESFVKLGGQIVEEVSYQSGDRDFSSQLTKVRVKRPDIIFAPGYYTEVGNMIRQARTQGVRATFLGGDGWSSPKLFELAGEAIAGHYFSDHFSPDDTDPKVVEFVKKFKARFKKEPSAMAALAYDAVYVVADAVRRNGNKVDSAGLKNALNSTKGLRGVSGTITLDANRNASKPLVVLETQYNRATKQGRATFKARVSP